MKYLMFLVVAALSCIGGAQGYSYQLQPPTPNPSGGTTSGKGGTRSFSQGSQGYGGGTQNATGTATASGTVKYVFTWSGPANTAPTNVIATETSSASWGGVSGSCSDGLGDAPTPSSGFITSQTSSGTHYSILNGGATVEVDVTVSASGTTGTTTDPNGQQIGIIGSASAYVSVSLTPIIISVSGLDPNSNALVGQYLIGSTSAGPFQLSAFHYNLPSGSFLGVDWGNSTPPTLPVTSFTTPPYHVSTPDIGENIDSTVTFFCGNPSSNSTLTCTVNVADPNGNPLGQATGSSLPFSILTPTHFLTLSCGTSYASPNSTNPGAIYAGNPGMKLSCYVSEQSEFITSEGNGEYCEVQLVKGYSYVVVNGVNNYHKNITVQSLDTTFPYGYDPINDASKSCVVANTGPSSESPSQDTPGLGVGGGTAYKISYNFDNFLAFQPPNNGNGQEIVPLAHNPWTWLCSGNVPGVPSGNPTLGGLTDPASPSDMDWTGAAS